LEYTLHVVIKQVCTNGLVSFGLAWRFPTGSIPVGHGTPIIAAYWSDLIISGSFRKGRIYYRSTSSGDYSIASFAVVLYVRARRLNSKQQLNECP